MISQSIARPSAPGIAYSLRMRTRVPEPAPFRLNFPSLDAAYTVGILETPFQHSSPRIICDHRRLRHFFFTDSSGDANGLAKAKFGSAAVHVNFAVEFLAIPIRHALGHEEHGDVSRRRGNLDDGFDFGHGAERKSNTAARKCGTTRLISDFGGAKHAIGMWILDEDHGSEVLRVPIMRELHVGLPVKCLGCAVL